MGPPPLPPPSQDTMLPPDFSQQFLAQLQPPQPQNHVPQADQMLQQQFGQQQPQITLSVLQDPAQQPQDVLLQSQYMMQPQGMTQQSESMMQQPHLTMQQTAGLIQQPQGVMLNTAPAW